MEGLVMSEAGTVFSFSSTVISASLPILPRIETTAAPALHRDFDLGLTPCSTSARRPRG